jgi:hypothetical protein
MRQTRLGVRSSTQTPLGELKTRFDFDLFGFGADVGQTTIHLISAFAEIGKLGVGQTASILMDPDVFPVTLDYWGIGSYFADALTDVGPQQPRENPGKPFEGKALPVSGAFLFAEVSWAAHLQSSFGYSIEVVANSDLQQPDAFHTGQYGLVNLRYYPTENILVGIEYQYGRRDNFSDGYHAAGHKVQVSAKVNFSSLLKSM